VGAAAAGRHVVREGSALTTYAVHIEDVAEQLLAASRERTTMRRVSQDIRRLLEAPWALIRERPELRRGGHNVALYHDAATVEVGIQIVAPFAPTDLVVCSATPAGTVATTAHLGPYDALGYAHDAVHAWCARSQRRLAGPFWEIYGDWNDDPSQLRTDVLYLLA
jgi:hypothetical protein